MRSNILTLLRRNASSIGGTIPLDVSKTLRDSPDLIRGHLLLFRDSMGTAPPFPIPSRTRGTGRRRCWRRRRANSWRISISFPLPMLVIVLAVVLIMLVVLLGMCTVLSVLVVFLHYDVLAGLSMAISCPGGHARARRRSFLHADPPTRLFRQHGQAAANSGSTGIQEIFVRKFHKFKLLFVIFSS